MVFRDEIILFEYFTAMPCIKKSYNKKIFIEAQNLSNKLISCFLKDKDLKKIHVIRNIKISQLKNNKIQYHHVSKNVSHSNIFKLLKINDMILISPESNRINIKLTKKLNKKFNLLNSSYDIQKMFSSKKKNL
jgi:predicted ATP-grasp superfamily ATP-dependent carboligase